jgi:hypothetical protein
VIDASASAATSMELARERDIPSFKRFDSIICNDP